jgi:cellulose synthase/poly-beta-1,6-N-acetylglucosamine synthase-like glycosyltransferase
MQVANGVRIACELLYNMVMSSLSNPVVSVVVPAYNEQDRIAKLLQSLVDQDFKENFEVIVVDNNCQDKTVEIVRSFATRLPNLKVVKETQQSIAAARNRGFGVATAMYIASADSDIVLPPDWLTILYKGIKAPGVVALVGMYQFSDQNIFFRIIIYTFMVIIDFIQRLLTGGFSLRGGNSIIRRDAFKKVGGFNQKIKNLEDVEISFRLKKLGKIVYLPKLVVNTSYRRFRGKLFTQLYRKIQSYYAITLGDINKARHPGNFR